VTAFTPVSFYYARSADDRRLAVQLSGDHHGEPVFYLHGTPGSRVGPRPTNRELTDRNVWLISFDRPGYGRSDRLESRTVADVAPDVEAIADGLGLERFAVLGRSGGGPHALACAALLPKRVTRAAALVSLAPWQAQGLDWFAGMADSNVDAYTVAASDPEALITRLVQAAAMIMADPASHIAVLTPEMPEADRRIVADKNIRALLVQNFFEGLRISAGGWIDDVLAFCSPWGFDVSDIRVPVYLWHGARDVFSPVAHSQWLAERIPGATTKLPPDRAHFGALEMVPSVLSWLSGQTSEVQHARRSLIAQYQLPAHLKNVLSRPGPTWSRPASAPATSRRPSAAPGRPWMGCRVPERSRERTASTGLRGATPRDAQVSALTARVGPGVIDIWGSMR
jgi:pimeloyl-ACP methyl ester carboxylesterase